MLFMNRRDAGKQLGKKLLQCKYPSPMIIVLPPGGTAVGVEVAALLQAPLATLGAIPLRQEGQPYLDSGQPPLPSSRALPPQQTHSSKQKYQLRSGEQPNTPQHPSTSHGNPLLFPTLPDLHGHTAVIVGDGLADGKAAQAALAAVVAHHPAKTVMAVPIGDQKVIDAVRCLTDAVVCLHIPPDFRSMSLWYS